MAKGAPMHAANSSASMISDSFMVDLTVVNAAIVLQ
jgi:hypothetical protein